METRKSKNKVIAALAVLVSMVCGLNSNVVCVTEIKRSFCG